MSAPQSVSFLTITIRASYLVIVAMCMGDIFMKCLSKGSVAVAVVMTVFFVISEKYFPDK